MGNAWDAEYGFGLIQMDAALLIRINPPRPKSPTPQYDFGYSGILTPTVILTPTPTILQTIVVTPAIPRKTPEINALTNTTSTLIVITPMATPLSETIASNNDSGSPPGSALLLAGGVCLLLGGIALVLFLFINHRIRDKKEE
jgi:hypothetical protein